MDISNPSVSANLTLQTLNRANDEVDCDFLGFVSEPLLGSFSAEERPVYENPAATFPATVDSSDQGYGSSAFGFLGIALPEAYQYQALPISYFQTQSSETVGYFSQDGYVVQSDRLLPQLPPASYTIPLLHSQQRATFTAPEVACNSDAKVATSRQHESSNPQDSTAVISPLPQTASALYNAVSLILLANEEDERLCCKQYAVEGGRHTEAENGGEMPHLATGISTFQAAGVKPAEHSMPCLKAARRRKRTPLTSEGYSRPAFQHACTEQDCGQKFQSRPELLSHKRSHNNRPYKCGHPGCTRAFAAPAKRDLHMYKHSGDKPFRCTFEPCTKSFDKQSALIKHERCHSGERPFACDVAGCDKRFVQRAHLEAHMRTHTGARPYKCEHEGCDLGFTTSSALIRHKHCHGDAKRYSCEQPGCHKKFARLEGLRMHTKAHSKEYGFVCKECGKGFAIAYGLQRHLHVHERKRAVQENDTSFRSAKAKRKTASRTPVIRDKLKRQKKHSQSHSQPEILTETAAEILFSMGNNPRTQVAD